MTRDEAIHKIRDSSEYYAGTSADALANALHSLGLLKFDEPKSVLKKARNVIYSSGLNISPDVVIALLDRAGLEIVEKD